MLDAGLGVGTISSARDGADASDGSDPTHHAHREGPRVGPASRVRGRASPGGAGRVELDDTSAQASHKIGSVSFGWEAAEC